MKSNTSNENILLIEYQAAQDSAQHHDNLVWHVTNILWAASFILFGVILMNIGEKIKYILLILSLIGFIMIIYSWVSAMKFSFIRNNKYDRCKDIEKELGMKQHTELKYKRRVQRSLYAILTLVMLANWICLFIRIWIK